MSHFSRKAEKGVNALQSYLPCNIHFLEDLLPIRMEVGGRFKAYFSTTRLSQIFPDDRNLIQSEFHFFRGNRLC